MITVPISVVISFVVFQKFFPTNALFSALLSPVPYVLVIFSGYLPSKFIRDFARFVRKMKDLLWRNYQPTTFDFDEITDGVFLGRMPRNQVDLGLLKEKGIDSMIVLNEDWELNLTIDEVKQSGFETLHIPTPDYFCAAPHEIEQGVQYIKQCISENKKVYTHCFAGKGRSAVIVIAYLISTKGLSIPEANAYCKQKRSVVVNLDAFFGLKYQNRMLHRWYIEVVVERK